MKKLSILALAFATMTFTSCSKDDETEATTPTTGNLELNLDGLEELGDDYVYEGWLIVDDVPVSTGTFSSVTFPQTFTVENTVLDAASKFVLSIEPADDADPLPSETKLLAGDFSGDEATVSSEALLGDLAASSGKFILATPTDADDTNEESGVWFLDNTSGSAETGLELPTLPAGWKYEGWAVIDGTPVSTGTFTAADAADDNASTSPYKGTAGDGPGYPGEDFLMGSFGDINFPVDLRAKTIVISVEPSPDNSANPFTLKPLATTVAADAALHTAIALEQGPVVELSGTVNR